MMMTETDAAADRTETFDELAAAVDELPEPSEDSVLKYVHPGKEWNVVGGPAEFTITAFYPNGPCGGVAEFQITNGGRAVSESERSNSGISADALAPYLPEQTDRGVMTASGLIRELREFQIGEKDARSYEDAWWNWMDAREDAESEDADESVESDTGANEGGEFTTEFRQGLATEWNADELAVITYRGSNPFLAEVSHVSDADMMVAFEAVSADAPEYGLGWCDNPRAISRQFGGDAERLEIEDQPVQILAVQKDHALAHEDTASAFHICGECQRVFDSDHGVSVHRGHAHRDSANGGQELVTDGGEDEPAVFLAGVDRNAWLNLTVDTGDGEVQVRAFVVDNYSERATRDAWGRVPGSVALSLETDGGTFERLELPAEVINVNARELRRGEFTELMMTVWDPVRGDDGEWKDEYSRVGTVTAASVEREDEDDD